MSIKDAIVSLIKSESPRSGDILVGDGLDVETIQGAVDMAPEHSEDYKRDEGAKIYVTSKYDSSKEQFPIRVPGKQITIEGHDRSSGAVVVPKGVSQPAFIIESEGSRDYRNKRTLRNLRIENGEPAVLVLGAKGFVAEDLIFRTPNHGAIVFRKDPETGETCTSNHVNRCLVYWPKGNAGFVIEQDAAGHATRFTNCEVTNAENHGFILNGANVTLRDSIVQGCGGYAVRIFSGASTNLDSLYFEKNGQNLSYPIDIDLHNKTVNTNISNIWSHARGSTKRVINVRDVVGLRVSNISAQGFGSGGTNGEIVGVHRKNTGVEIEYATLWAKGDATYIVNDEPDGATVHGHHLPDGMFGGGYPDPVLHPKTPSDSNGGTDALRDSPEDETVVPSWKSYSILKGTQFETQVHVYDSGEPGPTTMVTGGLHGDEIASQNVVKSLTLSTIPNGKLVVIPTCNAKATAQGFRGIDFGDPETQDNEFDLNRKFPASGECEGSVAQAIWAEVEKHQPDFLWDLHTSRGSWKRSSQGGVGQAMFTTPGQAKEFADRASHWTNEKFSLVEKNEFRTLASITGDDPMLVDRYYTQFNRPAGIIEASRDGTTMEEREDWLVCMLSTTMKQYSQQPVWN